jgi:hypothetical protein
MIKINIEQHSPAWYAIKLGRITGSRFKDAMSGDSTAGFTGLIGTMAAEIITGEMEDTFVSDQMARGTELEPEARRAYETLTEQEVEQVGFIMPEENTEFHEYTGFSPDGLINDDGLLELKAPMAKTHLNYIEKNVLPNEYKWQVQGGLWQTGRKYCDFVSYYPGMKLFIKRVYPDLLMHRQLEAECRKVIAALKLKLIIYNHYNHLNLKP